MGRRIILLPAAGTDQRGDLRSSEQTGPGGGVAIAGPALVLSVPRATRGALGHLRLCPPSTTEHTVGGSVEEAVLLAVSIEKTLRRRGGCPNCLDRLAHPGLILPVLVAPSTATHDRPPRSIRALLVRLRVAPPLVRVETSCCLQGRRACSPATTLPDGVGILAALSQRRRVRPFPGPAAGEHLTATTTPPAANRPCNFPSVFGRG